MRPPHLKLTNHYDFASIMGIFKLESDATFNAIHYDGESKTYFVKRFIIETNTLNKRFLFITESRSSKLMFISKGIQADVVVTYKDGRSHEKKQLDLINLIDVKGWKAIGNKLPVQNVIKVELVQETPKEPVAFDLEAIKNEVKARVEDEEKQLGLFGGNEDEES